MVTKKSGQSKEMIRSNSKPKSRSLASKDNFSKAELSSEGKSKSVAKSQAKSKVSKREEGDEQPVDEALLKTMGRALTHNQCEQAAKVRNLRDEQSASSPHFAQLQGRTLVLREAKKKTLTELKYHVKEKYPVQTDGTLLVSAVPRPDFYILHEHIEVKKKLGGGAFGEVFTGVWKKNDSETVDVAVKKLKGMMLKKQRTEFVKEAKLMKRFDHANIVRVFGVAPQEEPVMIVLELASGGSLLSHLKTHPDVTTDQLLNYCTATAIPLYRSPRIQSERNPQPF
ncbi:hypothetical protein L596_025952 [Steinernema carpocapsae]|uniref:non-specific protein-tyrosine kinase n=1 Tax=Steinernema carpocapsae TaxID=34508 RepID=A0A4U5MB01_STECR|nr:hypothetical protein L596_025952 [Steinernema carpocapsae]